MKHVHIINLVNQVIDIYKDNIKVVETGTIRSYGEKHESTRHIGEALGDKGNLISIDIESNSINIAKDICKDLNNIDWILGDSIKQLEKLHNNGYVPHVALLDSVNDSNHIFKEFEIVRDMGVKFIIIDDAGISLKGELFDTTHPDAVKGRRVYKYCVDNNINCNILQTIQGTQLLINNTNIQYIDTANV